MQIPKNTIVAVADGEQLKLFRNNDDNGIKLAALPVESIASDNRSGGSRHRSSSANPDDSQIEEDSFAAGVADYLNGQTSGGKIDKLVIIAAPRTLGELRKHYHKTMSSALLAEVAKDLTGHSITDIEKAVTAA